MEFPEPLFESFYYPINRACLVCGKYKAYSTLCTTKPIIPICRDCSANWNFYGYGILKKVKPLKVFWNVARFQPWAIIKAVKDFKSFAKWANKMKRIKEKHRGVL